MLANHHQSMIQWSVIDETGTATYVIVQSMPKELSDVESYSQNYMLESLRYAVDEWNQWSASKLLVQYNMRQNLVEQIPLNRKVVIRAATMVEERNNFANFSEYKHCEYKPKTQEIVLYRHAYAWHGPSMFIQLLGKRLGLENLRPYITNPEKQMYFKNPFDLEII